MCAVEVLGQGVLALVRLELVGVPTFGVATTALRRLDVFGGLAGLDDLCT
jgi:hypothetical protein